MDYRTLPYAPECLPPEIPVFPLTGVLLLPGGELPLNVFEPRYIAMVDDALRTPSRMIGMIQPRTFSCDARTPPSGEALFTIGCAGRITAFAEQADGRYVMTLRGVCRFQVLRELENVSGYRRVTPCWELYTGDIQPAKPPDFDRARLHALLERYFDLHHLDCDWNAVKQTPDERLITVLSMICPLDPGEKQALLEAACCLRRAELFMNMLEMAIYGERLGDCSLFSH
ncbi:MAG: LON peptidase substrate-binding domain-containing protein [Alphaproteobacteria bacterium]|nr:LON peptidase substrate-binding domain-containing protein [Alphaproteobacteria bacterium]